MSVDKFFLPDSDKYTVRFLSGKPFFLAARLHHLGSMASGRTFFCHKTIQDGKWVGTCLACKHYADFHEKGQPRCYKGSDSDFQNDLRSIKPIERFYYNCIVRGKEEIGPKVLAVGKSVHQQILSSILGESGSPTFCRPLGDVSHPISGNDFAVVRSMKDAGGGGAFPIYTGQFLPSSSLGTEEQIQEWLDARHDLSECVTLRPESEMLAALEEIFGYLGAARGRKKVYRSITAPFEPGW